LRESREKEKSFFFQQFQPSFLTHKKRSASWATMIAPPLFLYVFLYGEMGGFALPLFGIFKFLFDFLFPTSLFPLNPRQRATAPKD